PPMKFSKLLDNMHRKPLVIVGGVMFVLSTLLSFNGTALSQDWPIGTFYYEITRKKDQTGILKIVSKRQGEDVVVETEEWLDDTGYCHASKRREVWHNGTLVAFESSTAGWCSVFVRMFRPSACPWDEFGDPITVSVVRKDKVLFEKIGSENSQQISGEAVPTNFLNPAFRGSDHIVRVMNPITGELGSMIISNKGVENLSIGNTSEKTEHYVVQVQDGQDRDLWYDMRGVWIKMFLQGDAVTFAAADPAKMESELTSFVSKSGCLRKLPNHTGKKKGSG
ncbi:MAG: DUF6134 family protein, partial [Candidatus Methylomirabilales bacterium]